MIKKSLYNYCCRHHDAFTHKHTQTRCAVLAWDGMRFNSMCERLHWNKLGYQHSPSHPSAECVVWSHHNAILSDCLASVMFIVVYAFGILCSDMFRLNFILQPLVTCSVCCVTESISAVRPATNVDTGQFWATLRPQFGRYSETFCWPFCLKTFKFDPHILFAVYMYVLVCVSSSVFLSFCCLFLWPRSWYEWMNE